MGDLTGRTVGHYRIAEKVGQGGMGVVYRAHDERLKRDVAVKVLPEDVAQNPERLARFEREARAVAMIDHPNILAIYDYGNDQGVAYAVTELLDGKTLLEIIPPVGMPWQTVIEIGSGIADGLAAAHTRGIIHRDLKPSNIFVTSDGRVKLLDFGLAKVIEPVRNEATTVSFQANGTEPGAVFGTNGYMSPEQVRGEPADCRSDVFVLGCVLYEMVSGRNPFLKKNPAETAAAILREDPTTLSSAGSVLPPKLEGTIHRCFEKEPSARYESAADVSSALRNLETQPSISSTESPPRIVVLPFENLGPPDDDHVADGLVEEITTRLSAIPGLHVISRTSARQYKDRCPPLKTIAEELNVEYVIEGSVRWQRHADGPHQVRITPRLIDVESDRHLWSEIYDEEVDALFDIQSDIAVQVVHQLNVRTLDLEAEIIDARPTDNPEAYEAFLRGQHYDGVDDSRQIRLAASMYERAVELDPEFAVAWAYLAEKRLLLYCFSHDRSIEHRDAGRQAAERSLAIDSSLPEGHRALGFFHHIQHDYEKALREFSLAHAARPNDVRALAGQAAVLRVFGRWIESTKLLEHALEISPRDSLVLHDISDNFLRIRRFKRAEECADLLISLLPDQSDGYIGKFDLLFNQGRFREARSVFSDLPVESPKMRVSRIELEIADREYRVALEKIDATPESAYEEAYGPSATGFRAMHECLCHFFLGDHQRVQEVGLWALEITNANMSGYPDDRFLACELGMIFAMLGRREEALQACETALSQVREDIREYMRPIMGFEVAPVYAIAGELEEAMNEIEYLLSVPSAMSVGFLRHHPYWDGLRNYQRFEQLLKRFDADHRIG